MLFISLYQKNAKEDCVEIRITRKELAEQLGISVKTVNRAMKKMQEEGFITRKGNGIVIYKAQYDKMKGMVGDIVET